MLRYKNIGQTVKKIFEIIEKLLFPPKCIFCTSILDIHAKVNICSDCHKILGYIGNKLYYVNKFFSKKLGQHKYFDRIFCVFEYSGYVKEAIIRYKYFGKAWYYKTFAWLLADMLLNDRIRSISHGNKVNEYDMIISVPLHKAREKKRGYNQACLISKELSRVMKLPEASSLLIRTKNTAPQSLLQSEYRNGNIKNAFKVTDVNKIKGKKILLIDDVMTTGSTVNECSRVLKEAGAVKVDIAVIAVAFVFEL